MSAEEEMESPLIEYEIRTHDHTGYETFFIMADVVEITVNLIPMLNLYIYESSGFQRTVGVFRNWVYCKKR